MNYSKLARPALVFVALAAFAACKSGSGTSSTSPSPSPAASSAAARPAAAATPMFTAAMVTMGDSLFHLRSCKNCHGPDAMGRTNGPKLIATSFLHVNGSYDDFVRIITTGVPAAAIKDPSHPNPMAPRGGARPAPLTDDEIKDIAAYLYKLNHP